MAVDIAQSVEPEGSEEKLFDSNDDEGTSSVSGAAAPDVDCAAACVAGAADGELRRRKKGEE
jgi:hypothetical protein